MVAVALLDGEAAADAGLLAALRKVVNEAYARGEVGLWREGTERIAGGGLRALIASGQLAAAREDGQVVGCVRVSSLDARTASSACWRWPASAPGRASGARSWPSRTISRASAATRRCGSRCSSRGRGRTPS